MTFQDRLEITTSEGVTVRLTIAGIGSRTLAWLLDGLVVGAAVMFLGLISFRTVDTDSLLTLGLISLAALLVPFTYFVAMETLNGGRTLGKMAAGIKVVRVTGAPVGFGGAVVRALFLPIDILLFGVGIVSMFASEKSQRIGDIAARTVVVRDRIRPTEVAHAPALPVGEDLPRWDVSAITEQEIGVIRSFLSRAPGLPLESRMGYATQLRSRLEPRIGGADGSLADEAFLARIVAEKHRD